MMRTSSVARWLILVLLVALPTGALAAPVSYGLTSGQITTVQFFDSSGRVAPCPIGSAINCLANGPVSIDSGSITLDTAGPALIAMNLKVNGPAVLDLSGAFGIRSIELSNLSFVTAGPSPLSPLGGGAFNFGPAAGTLTTDVVVNRVSGRSRFFQGVDLPSAPSGTLFLDPSATALNLVGVELGQVCVRRRCLTVKADFSFTAAIPEPGGFLVFGIGTLLVAAARGRGGRKERAV